jgi:hypothetical protein
MAGARSPRSGFAGRRAGAGLGLGPSEAETFWSTFLKGLVRRGLKEVKLVISDAHDGLKQAAAKALKATWQRCRVPLGDLMIAVPCGRGSTALPSMDAQCPGPPGQGPAHPSAVC